MEQLSLRVSAGRQFQAGDFGPIYSKRGIVPSHRPAGVVFYPHGNASSLYDHLFRDKALPAGYEALVVPITWDFVEGIARVHPGQVLPLSKWENRYGTAQGGFLSGRERSSSLYFGGPYPPAASSPLRASFDKCLPLATPQIIWFERWSPVRLMLRDAQGHRFGYDSRGRLINELAGIIRPGHPTRYGIPAGAYTASLAGTARGRATLVISSPAKTGTTVSVY